MLDIEELRAEVYRKHGKRIDADDPIFITITLNELLLYNHLEKLQLVLNHNVQQVEAQYQAQLNDFLNADVMQANNAITAMTSNFEAAEKRIIDSLDNRIAEFAAVSKNSRLNIQAGMKTVNSLAIVLSLGLGIMAGILFKTYFVH